MAKKQTPAPETESKIKQGSIAQFMRKRTQLVGFDFGHQKHVQYAIEFVDNSLDAIESFQWNSMKNHRDLSFVLKDDVLLEDFSYNKGGITFEDFEGMNQQEREMQGEEEGLIIDMEEGEEHTELLLDGKDETELPEGEENFTRDVKESENIEENGSEEEKKLKSLQMKAEDLEDEVQVIITQIEKLLEPIEPIVDREPFVIMRIDEEEAPDIYSESAGMNKKSKSMMYHIQMFDNGTGMPPQDLAKFGKYLASSKSIKLKQTRGSQGFGSPSAFSDAQNTTGKQITVVSKDYRHLYGIASEFYTTSKNNKSYVVPPTEIECPFQHGTYISLTYLNIKYINGYIDKYFEYTALTNPHVSLIFIDPKGKEHIFMRKVGRFPRQPTYALPHPDSVSIGDFQDTIRNSEKDSIKTHLLENYVRMSPRLAKNIIEVAEYELERHVNYLSLGEKQDLYSNCIKNKTDPFYITHQEKRKVGRKKENIDVLYQIPEDNPKYEEYWGMTSQIKKNLIGIKKFEKSIRKKNNELIATELKKEKTLILKEIKIMNKEIVAHKKEIAKHKKQISDFVTKIDLTPELELPDTHTDYSDVVDGIDQLRISEQKPYELSQVQIESLFKGFRAQNYLGPPSDPAVPIGSSVLETTLLKEFNLSLSYRTDLFDGFKNEELQSLDESEVDMYAPRILSKFNQHSLPQEEFKAFYKLNDVSEFTTEAYLKNILKFEIHDDTGDDFITADTRAPISGKGLAFVVEAAVAISPKIDRTNRAIQSVMRYVNRTPKMRDNAECAIWKGIQSVNWKNYKLDVFDNGIPKGNLRILVNVSGPYVHLMFKSQSKNALAEDDVLLKEIKLCLETIGRKVRHYMNKKTNRKREQKRESTIARFVPQFIKSLVNIASNQIDYRHLKPKTLENRILETLGGKIKDVKEVPKSESELAQIRKKEEKIAEKELKSEEDKKIKEKAVKINEPGEVEEKIEEKAGEVEEKIEGKTSEVEEEVHTPKKTPVIEKEESFDGVNPKRVRTLDSILGNKKAPVKQKKSTITPVPAVKKSTRPTPTKKTTTTKKATPSTTKTAPPVKLAVPKKKLTKPTSRTSSISKINDDNIMKVFNAEAKWMNIKEIVKRLNIQNMNDVRYLQLKLKALARNKKLKVTVKTGKKYFKKTQ